MAKRQDLARSKKMIATFMKASAPLEAYLQAGGELTDTDLNSIELTITGLVTFLDTWKRKHTTLKLSSNIPLVRPSSRGSRRKPVV
jgi:hypothetical protein